MALAPGYTAHSLFGVAEAGNICAKPVWAVNLRVQAPRQWNSSLLRFKFQACHGHRTVMVVGPVQPGRG